MTLNAALEDALLALYSYDSLANAKVVAGDGGTGNWVCQDHIVDGKFAAVALSNGTSSVISYHRRQFAIHVCGLTFER